MRVYVIKRRCNYITSFRQNYLNSEVQFVAFSEASTASYDPHQYSALRTGHSIDWGKAKLIDQESVDGSRRG